METAALMGRLELLLLQLLSINMCVITYASAGRTHGSKRKKESVQSICASYGTPSNISGPCFQLALGFLIPATISWTKKLSIPEVSNLPRRTKHSSFTSIFWEWEGSNKGGQKNVKKRSMLNLSASQRSG